MVERVLAGENQMVILEQVIAELGTWQQDHDIAATTAALERQQAELALLQHGAKAEAISAAREQRDMAQVRAGHGKAAGIAGPGTQDRRGQGSGISRGGEGLPMSIRRR